MSTGKTKSVAKNVDSTPVIDRGVDTNGGSANQQCTERSATGDDVGDGHGNNDDDEEDDGSEDDGSSDEDEEDNQRSVPTAAASDGSLPRVGSLTTALEAIWRRQNRIVPAPPAPETEERSSTGARFGNFFALVRPFDADTAVGTMERLDRVRQAAQVNRSKLWTDRKQPCK
ncbi:hypothetical protein PINS_up014144 [Pythium insidiosum]|nr:hypothetical protein PINS_up014144 [Pythium insidiosum]